MKNFPVETGYTTDYASLTHLQPVEIRWLDSMTMNGWRTVAEMLEECKESNPEMGIEHLSLGYFIECTDRTIIICNSIREGEVKNYKDRHVQGLVQIPKVSVIGLKTL